MSNRSNGSKQKVQGIVLWGIIIALGLCIGLFGASNVCAGGPEELDEESDLTWKEIVQKGETPVGSKVDGAYIEDGEIKEENHPLPDLSDFKKVGTREYDVLDEVPGKETKIKVYAEKGNPQHQIWIGIWNGDPAAYFHSNPDGSKNWDGRGTYDNDENFEQKQGTKWPDFWHNHEAFFPEHYD